MDRSRSKPLIVIVLAAAVGAALVAGAVAWMFGPQPLGEDESLEVLGEVPAFELLSHREEPVTRDDLLGKVWVAEFIFTSCGGICPVMVQNLVALDEALADAAGREDLRLVSFTVDPGHDRPDALRAFAERHGAEGEHWLFLTTPEPQRDEREPIWRLSREGFMLGVSEAPHDPVMPISHSGQFVLVDRDGRIRAYHSGTSAAEREQLVADVKRLLRE